MRRKIALFLAFSLFWSNPGYSLTLSDIQTEIRRLVRDTSTDTTLQRYSNTVLTSFINEVQRDVVNQTWAIVTSTSQTLTDGLTDLSLPDDFIVAVQVRFTDASSSKVTYLEENMKKVLYQENPDFLSDTGSPAEYYIWQPEDTTNPIRIGYYPAANSTSTGTAVVDYYAQPTDLSSSSDVPFNGLLHLVPYHYTLVYGVVAKIKLIQFDHPGAERFQGLYKTSVETMIDRLGRLPNYFPSIQAGSGR